MLKFQFELKYKPIKDLELAVLGAFKYAASSQEHLVKDKSNQAEAYRAMGTAVIRESISTYIKTQTIHINCLRAFFPMEVYTISLKIE